MPAPTTAWTRRALDELADGDWHPYADIVATAATTVPPGRAYRSAEYNRQHPTRRSAPGPRVRGDADTAIATGARETARRAILQLIRRGTVQRDGDRIRLTRSAS